MKRLPGPCSCIVLLGILCSRGCSGVSRPPPGSIGQLLVHEQRYGLDAHIECDEASKHSQENVLDSYDNWLTHSQPIGHLREDLNSRGYAKEMIILIVPFGEVDRSTLQQVEDCVKEHGNQYVYAHMKGGKPIPPPWTWGE